MKPKPDRPRPAYTPPPPRLVTFKDGPLKGEVLRWYEPHDPPFWDHVTRTMEPLQLGADGEIPDGVVAFAELEDDRGNKVFLTEVRTAYRYRPTLQVTPMRARVYELDPTWKPVPLEYDLVADRWKTLADYEPKSIEEPVVEPPASQG